MTNHQIENQVHLTQKDRLSYQTQNSSVLSALVSVLLADV